MIDKNGKEFYQILEISYNAIDFSRLVDQRCPFLLDHDKAKIVGVVEKAYISGNKLYVDVRFSENTYAQNALKDIKAGIRRNVSIGYIVNDYIIEQEGEKTIQRVTSWMPYECSSLACPADPTVGYQRSLTVKRDESIDLDENSKDETKEDSAETKEEIKEEVKEDAEETKEDSKETKEESKEEVKEEVKEETDNSKEETKNLTEEKDETRACDNEDKTEVRTCPDEDEIRALGRALNKEKLAENFIERNLTLSDFKKEIMTKSIISKEKDMEQKHFSLVKALLNAKGQISDEAAAYEKGISDENKRAFSGYQFAQANSVVVTRDQLRAGFDGTSDAPLHPAQYRPDLYAGTLAKENTLARVGVRVVPTAGESISFAVATSGINGGYTDGNNPVTSGDMAFAQKLLTPHKYGAQTAISYFSKIQDNPIAESIAFDELFKSLEYVKDQAAFNGDGTNGAPSGLLNTAGLNTVALTGTVELSTALEFEKKIRESGDYSPDLKWVMGTTAYYNWCNTPVKSTAQNEFLVDYKTGKCIGYEAVCSPAVPPSTVILGNFNEMLVADFAPLEFFTVVDKDLAARGAEAVMGMGANDVAIRRPSSFTKSL